LVSLGPGSDPLAEVTVVLTVKVLEATLTATEQEYVEPVEPPPDPPGLPAWTGATVTSATMLRLTKRPRRRELAVFPRILTVLAVIN